MPPLIIITVSRGGGKSLPYIFFQKYYEKCRQLPACTFKKQHWLALTNFSSYGQREVFSQIKKQSPKEYFVYFEGFVPQSYGKYPLLR